MRCSRCRNRPRQSPSRRDWACGWKRRTAPCASPTVTTGSLAETTGLKAGDQIVEIAGLPVSSTLRAITAVRLQPAGTWLPLRVKRGDDTLDLIVKFPPKP